MYAKQLNLFDDLQTNVTPTPIQQTEKRFKAYAWVTWLAQLMAGYKKCQYPFWLRTQYRIPTQPSDYDSSEHDAMVIQSAAELEQQGFTVSVEKANAFKVNGKTYDICVSGCPDIFATKDDWGIIADCKTGKRHKWHLYQVRLYMLLFPLAPETKALCFGHIPHGRLIYPDATIEIPAWSIDDAFKVQLRQTIAQLTSPQVPHPNPHFWECRYCSLSGDRCSFKQDS